jgi:hypothetical protein
MTFDGSRPSPGIYLYIRFLRIEPERGVPAKTAIGRFNGHGSAACTWEMLFGDMECNQRSEYPVQWLSIVSVILIVNPLSGWNVIAETTTLIRSKHSPALSEACLAASSLLYNRAHSPYNTLGLHIFGIKLYSPSVNKPVKQGKHHF